MRRLLKRIPSAPPMPDLPRTPSPGRRTGFSAPAPLTHRRRSARLTVLGFAVAVVLLLLVSGSFTGLLPTTRAMAGPAVGVLTSGLGEDEVAAAEASLAAGGGPAGGSPLPCSTAAGGLSASCSSPSAGPPALTLTAFTVKPVYDALDYPATFTTNVTGGSPPYTYAYSGLPTPCTSTNVSSFSCNAYYLGVYNVTVTVTDSARSTVSATRSLDVECAGCESGLDYGSSINPAARTQAAIAYDIKDHYTVLFGGWNGSALFGDTWSFQANRWEPLGLLNAPSARVDASMAYDKKDGYVVLFGGWNTSGVLGDTWTFVGGAWTRLSTSIAPSARSGAALTWDARDNELVLFGGSNGTSTLSDTWAFAGGNWTRLSFSGPGSSPTGREDAAFTLDSRDNYPLLFGGLNISKGTSKELNDTWAFEHGVWVELPETLSPPARSQAVLAFDATLNYTVLFGGANVTAPRQLQDTWEFENGIWTLLSPAASPAPRQGAAGVWDQGDVRLMVFSGDELGLPSNIPDTWFYYAGNWVVDKSTPEFSYGQPAARIAGALAFDPTAGYTVFFGGLTQYGANGETWAYADEQWTELFPSSAPSARSYAGMAYDAKDGYLVLFGGLSASGVPLNDTWTMTPTPWIGKGTAIAGGPWVELSTPVAPSPRYGMGATYDTADSVFLVFGGTGTSGTLLGDTWSFTGGSWTRVLPGGSGTSPSARGFPLLVNDPKDNYVVLFGGMSGGTLLNDTWTYKAGVWTSLSLTVHPSGRWGAASVFDPVNSIVFLFGGCAQAVNPTLLRCDALLNDSWRFLGGSWSELLGRNPAPFPRAGAAIVYDGSTSDVYVLLNGGLVNRTGELLTTERWDYTGIYVQWAEPLYPSARMGAESIYETRDQHIVMFGGYGPLPSGGVGYLNDTWVWDTDVWNQAAAPGPVCKGCANHHPSARAFGAIGWDPVDQETIYFGGENQNGYLGDTWSWVGSYTTGQWTELTPTHAPTARANESMAWDETDGYMVLFGGQNTSHVFGDTWTFVGGQWTLRSPTVAPAARAGANLVYDSTSHQLLLFGGWNPVTKSAFNDTWEYAAGAWTQLSAASGPSPRYGATASDDPQDGAVMLFGGLTSTGTFLGDTWIFKSGAWTEVVTKTGSAPTPSAFSNVGNDESDGNVQLFGGYNGNYLGQFWVFY